MSTFVHSLNRHMIFRDFAFYFASPIRSPSTEHSIVIQNEMKTLCNPQRNLHNNNRRKGCSERLIFFVVDTRECAYTLYEYLYVWVSRPGFYPRFRMPSEITVFFRVRSTVSSNSRLDRLIISCSNDATCF